MWAINEDKAPEPDGYGSQFFKNVWGIVGKNLEDGVLEFFRIGKMLKGINATVITLIRKSTHVDYVGDYRPISCCNTIYKMI